LDNQHFLDCPLVNSKKNEVNEYKKILNGSMDEKIITLRKFQEEQKQRKKTLWVSVIVY
jgi:transcription initiation factor IIE alpha subunit